MFALGGAWTCYDNQAVTGHPFLLPYLLHDRQYNVTPVFWFLPLRPEPVYSHPRLESQHGTNGWEASVYRADQPWWCGLSIGLISSLQILGLSLGAPVLFTLLVPVAWRDPLYRKMVIVSGVFILALAVETFHYEHYAAPVFAALALMVAVWAEYAWKLKMGRLRVGVVLVVLALLFDGEFFSPVSSVSLAANNAWEFRFGVSFQRRRGRRPSRATGPNGAPRSFTGSPRSTGVNW